MFALGMQASMPRDKARLQALQVQQTATITTVSQCSVDYKLKGFNHLDINFKTARGAESIKNAIATKFKNLIANNESRKIIVLLDYFWLQKDYYENCYGTLWLTQHAQTFLNAGATEVILPVDRRYEPSVPSNMETMVGKWQQTCGNKVSAVFIAREDNPLWVASNGEWLEEHQFNGMPWSNQLMVSQYLNEDKPFLKITQVYILLCVCPSLCISL